MANKLLGPISEGRRRVTTTARPRWRGNQFVGVHCKLDDVVIWKWVYYRWRNPRDENHAGTVVGTALTLGINYGQPQYTAKASQGVLPPTEYADAVAGLGLGFTAINYNNENYSTNAMLWANGSTTLTNAPGTAGTSFVLPSGQGANFAAGSSVYIGTSIDSATFEMCLVGSVATDTLTVTRAQQNTVALNAQVGWTVYGAGYANLLKLLTDAGYPLRNVCMVPAASRWDQSYAADQTKSATILKNAGRFTYQAQSKQGPGNNIGLTCGTEARQIRTLNPGMIVGIQVSSQPQNWPNANPSTTDNHIAASDTFQQLGEISRQGADRPDYMQFFRPGSPDDGWWETLRAFSMFRPYWRGERWV